MKKKTPTKKSNVQLIISVLKTGETLKSKDISDIIAKEDGKFIKVQDVASMLSRVSNPVKSDLGYFLNKEPVGNTFAYHLYKEACGLSEDQIYGLTLKTGNSKYTIEQALKDFPALKTYVNNPKSLPKKAESKPAVKKAKLKPAKKVEAKPAKKVEAKPVKKAEPKPKPAKKAEAKPVKKVEAKPVAKKDVPKPAAKKAEPEKIIGQEETISPEKDVFEKLEKITAKLKAMDGKDNINIKDIDVNVSFRLGDSED